MSINLLNPHHAQICKPSPVTDQERTFILETDKKKLRKNFNFNSIQVSIHISLQNNSNCIINCTLITIPYDHSSF
jgi:hypothetical protein